MGVSTGCVNLAAIPPTGSPSRPGRGQLRVRLCMGGMHSSNPQEVRATIYGCHVRRI